MAVSRLYGQQHCTNAEGAGYFCTHYNTFVTLPLSPVFKKMLFIFLLLRTEAFYWCQPWWLTTTVGRLGPSTSAKAEVFLCTRILEPFRGWSLDLGLFEIGHFHPFRLALLRQEHKASNQLPQKTLILSGVFSEFHNKFVNLQKIFPTKEI